MRAWMAILVLAVAVSAQAAGEAGDVAPAAAVASAHPAAMAAGHEVLAAQADKPVWERTAPQHLRLRVNRIPFAQRRVAP